MSVYRLVGSDFAVLTQAFEPSRLDWAHFHIILGEAGVPPPPADAARLLRDFVHTQRLKLTRATAEALEDAVAEQMEGGATTTPRPIGGADGGNAGGDAGQDDASRQDEGQEEEEEEDRPAASPRAAAAEQQSRVAWEAAAVRLPLLLLPDTCLNTSVFDGCDLLTGLLLSAGGGAVLAAVGGPTPLAALPCLPVGRGAEGGGGGGMAAADHGGRAEGAQARRCAGIMLRLFDVRR